jgi:hypothetical protein
VKEAISYCGLCSAEKSSADKVMRMPISKQRNKHIQHVLVEAAKLAPRYSHELVLLREKEIQRGNKNRAIPGGSQEAGGLHEKLPDKEEQKQDHSMRTLPGPAANRPGNGGNS